MGSSSHSRRYPARQLAAVGVALALGVLAGCSGQSTTVDNSTSEDLTPLSLAPSTTSSSAAPSASTSATTTSPSSTAPASSTTATATSTDPTTTVAPTTSLPPGARKDTPAREVSSAPTFTAERTPADLQYLNAVKAAGIKTDGIEDQLIGTAVEVCRAKANRTDDATLLAVAGQLSTQSRTKLAPADAATAINKAATEAYCRTP